MAEQRADSMAGLKDFQRVFRLADETVGSMAVAMAASTAGRLGSRSVAAMERSRVGWLAE